MVFLDCNRQPNPADDDSDDDDSDYQPDDDDDDDDDSMYEPENENDDSSDDSTYYLPDDEHDPDDNGDDDGAGIPGVDTNEYDTANDNEYKTADDDEYEPKADNANNDADDEDADVDAHHEDYSDVDDEPPAGSAGVSTQDSHDNPAESAGVEPHENAIDTNSIEQEMDAKYGPRNQQYSMCRRKARDYSHLFVTSNNDGIHNYYECLYGEDEEDDEDVPADSNEEETDEDDEPLATPQMSMKKGIKVFGPDGVAAVKKEMLQLHERKVMSPKHAKELTPEQKQEALAYLMFLKRKRCGKVKGRGCADGQKQRAYTPREDAASPTMATESIFLTAVIDALEGRDVAIIDVAGAFMQADMDELVHVRFTGKNVGSTN
jgi:hypothetical protein